MSIGLGICGLSRRMVKEKGKLRGCSCALQQNRAMVLAVMEVEFDYQRCRSTRFLFSWCWTARSLGRALGVGRGSGRLRTCGRGVFGPKVRWASAHLPTE